QDPVEVRVEHVVPRRARIAGQRRHDHAAALGEPLEKRHPARQAAEPCEKAELRPAALAPDAAREAVDLHGLGLRFAHSALLGLAWTADCLALAPPAVVTPGLDPRA